MNINDNHVLLIQVSNEKYVVEVDSGEIIEQVQVNSYVDSIDEFIGSYSFASTHASIALLEPYLHFLSDEEIGKILEASSKNSQIYGVRSDSDVKQFITTLYEKKKMIFSSELRESIGELLG